MSSHWLHLPAFLTTIGSLLSLWGLVVGCGSQPRVELTLASFAVTKAAYDEIIPLFEEAWRQQHQQEVVIYQSYGGSGSQARAVIDGLEADVVHLALALDVEKIEAAGLIAPGWAAETPNGDGILTQSVSVIVTRPGNPKQIEDWADLTRPDMDVITPNPKTSGSARWNFLALWGSQLLEGGGEADAFAFASQVFDNVPVLPRDAREATDIFFKRQQGDALITYENEVILAQLNGENLPYVIPAVNISVDNPIAVVDKNVDKHNTREAAEAFVQFLYTPTAQREFAKVGFRPVNPSVAAEFQATFPEVKRLFSAHDIGDWSTIQKKMFDQRAIFDQIQAQISTNDS
ncbi:MAG: sulfate ABC transporter substrate-binding protein [Cyanobacteriota bacterium]|nr:sulfate ABC transporter substrate-binding protein [Cyanobacteriota bacterium]